MISFVLSDSIILKFRQRALFSDPRPGYFSPILGFDKALRDSGLTRSINLKQELLYPTRSTYDFRTNVAQDGGVEIGKHTLLCPSRRPVVKTLFVYFVNYIFRELYFRCFEPEVFCLLSTWRAHDHVKQSNACLFCNYSKGLAVCRPLAMATNKCHGLVPL